VLLNQTALESCDKVLELDPENQERMNAIVYTNRGNILLKLHNPIAAFEDFKTALRIDPKLGEAWIGKGTAQYHLGYLQLNNMPVIWLLIREINCMAGLIFLRKSRSCYTKAMQSFTEALKLNHPLAQTNLNLTQQKL
jgi:tetratricopeptide (TPR) repeat protein